MAPKKPKNTGNRDKKPGNVADQSGFDAKSGNVYNLPLRTLDGEQMQTNHFRLGCEIKVGGDYKHWYQYALSGVQLKSGGVGTTNGSSTSTIDSTPTGQASSVSGDPTNSTEQDAAIAANATGDETSTTADGTAVNVALGTTPATTQRNPSARIIRRVKRLFCSVNLKNEKYKDIPMVTNLKDKLITASPLPAELIGQDHEVKFTDENEASSRDPPVIYTITLGEQKIIRIGEALEYLRTKDVTHISGENPENIVKDVLAAINVIFSQYANAISIRTTKNEPRFTAKGETIYVVPEKLEFGDDGHQTDVIENDGYAWNLKGGLIALAGYIRSTRAVHNAQDPFLLRINTKTSPFYYGATKDQGTVQDLIDNYRTSSKFSRTWREVEEFVTGLRVRTDYMRSSPTFKASNERSYTIGGLPYTSEESPDYWDEGNKTTPTVGNIKFTVRDKATSKERRWSVQDWFKDKHGVDLNSNANSTWVVRIGDHNFLPASRLHVLPGQPYKAALAQPISYGCRSPKDNLAMILKQGIGQVFCIKKGTIFDFGASFGLVIEETPMSIKYQLLTAPNLQYNSRTILGTPSWNLRSNKFKKSIDATSGAKWTYVHIHLASEAVDTAHVSKVQEGFEKALTKCGIEGLPYEDNEGKQHHSISVGSKNDVEYALQDWYGTWRSSIKESKLRVLLVMLGEENFYPAVKRWGDLSAGIATICIKRKGREYQTNDQYYGNVCMKFNQKSSPQTINHGLHNKSSILSRDTMLVGMDVTHPNRPPPKISDKSKQKPKAQKPSVAAMVASIDSEFTQYPASLRYNDPPSIADLKEATEEIFDLDGMLDERLNAYKIYNNDSLPQRIIFFRDGLSEDQLQTYYKTEMARIRQCLTRNYTAAKADYPETMWMCTVKRHDTRFFADKTDAKLDGNPRSGVAFFEDVTIGHEKDFYLVSADTLKGTARPTHYVVLENNVQIADDNKKRTPTIKEIADMVYQLCFVYCKATKAVGLVTPSKLADKACDRARCFVESIYQGNGTAPTTRPNIQVHNSVKDIMYYI